MVINTDGLKVKSFVASIQLRRLAGIVFSVGSAARMLAKQIIEEKQSLKPNWTKIHKLQRRGESLKKSTRTLVGGMSFSEYEG